MDLDLRQVRYAVTLAEELNFGRAARRLTIAQQTLSNQIRSLEKLLGVQLFTRDRRHVALTPAGDTFVTHARPLLARAGTMIGEVTQTRAPLRIDVVTEGLPSTRLIEHLRAQTSGLPFEVVQSHGLSGALPGLLNGSLDLAFGRPHGLGRHWPDSLSAMPVGLVPIGIVLPSDHPLAEHDEVTLAELGRHPVLVHTANESAEWHDWTDQLVAAFGLTVATRVRGHGRTSVQSAVRALGHPAFGITTAHLSEGLTARRLIDPIPLYPWHAVWNSTTVRPDVTRALELIHDYARTHAWHRPPRSPWWLPEPDRASISGTA